jgi:hypothetical protein
MSLDISTLPAFPSDTGGVLVQVDPANPAHAVDNVFYFDVDYDGTTVRVRRHFDGRYRAAWVVNGAGDQTSRLQDVFDHAGVSEVVFDQGDVLIEGTLTVPTGKYVSFKGSGKVLGGGTGIINGGKFRWLKASYYSGITINPELVYTTEGGGGSANIFTGTLLFTLPEIVSAVTPELAPNTVIVTFNRDVTGVSLLGYSFEKDGVSWVASSVSGSGSVWTFTMATEANVVNVLTISYNPATGATIDIDGGELPAVTDSPIDNQSLSLTGILPHTSAFTAADGTLLTAYTPEDGWPWSNVLGSMKIVGNKATWNSLSGNYAICTTKLGTPEVVITSRYQKTTSTNKYANFLVRFEDLDKYMKVAIFQNSLRIYEILDGVATIIFADTALALVDDLLEHEIVITVGDNLISVAIDEIGIVSNLATDPVFTGTDVGIEIYDDTAVADCVVFNSFNVIEPVISLFPHISNFTAANGTQVEDYIPDAGGQWNLYAGAWEIQSNRLLPIYSGAEPGMQINLGGQQDFTIRAVYTLDSTTPYFVITFRAGVGVGVIMLVLHASIYMVDSLGGFSAPIASFASLTGADREVKFVVTGNTVDSYIDGVAVDTGRAIHPGNNGNFINVSQSNTATTLMSLNSFKAEAS